LWTGRGSRGGQSSSCLCLKSTFISDDKHKFTSVVSPDFAVKADFIGINKLVLGEVLELLIREVLWTISGL